MKKFKTKKNLNIRMMFFLVIFLLTLILYLDISSNFSLGLISLIEPVVKQNLTKSLSDNFKLSILKNYDIDNLVTIKYNDNNELADVNFRINDTYSLASEICNELKLFEFIYTGDLVNIILKVFVGSLIYVICLLIFRDEFLNEIIRKVLLKVRKNVSE